MVTSLSKLLSSNDDHHLLRYGLTFKQLVDLKPILYTAFIIYIRNNIEDDAMKINLLKQAKDPQMVLGKIFATRRNFPVKKTSTILKIEKEIEKLENKPSSNRKQHCGFFNFSIWSFNSSKNNSFTLAKVKVEKIIRANR